MRILRLARLIRLSRVHVVYDRIADKFPSLRQGTVLLTTLKIVSAICCLNHWIACVWFVCGHWENSDTGSRWIDLTGDAFGLESYWDSGQTYQYLSSVHWAVTQTFAGSMQVVPVNSIERVFNILCLMTGLIITSSLVASLSASLTQLKSQMSKRFTMLRMLRQYVVARRIGPGLGSRMEKAVASRLSRRQALALAEVQAIDFMPAALLDELHFVLIEPHIGRKPFICVCAQQDTCLTRTIACDVCELSGVSLGDFVFRARAEAGAFFCLPNLVSRPMVRW